MAELDRFERAFAPGWRKAFRRARMEGVSLEEVADILAESLTRDLRDCNGVQGFREVEHVVAEWFSLTLPASMQQERKMRL